MTSNDFLFDKPLNMDEKVSRIPSSVFDMETSEISTIVGESDGAIDRDDITKGRFIEQLHTEFSAERSEAFLESLFEQYGHTGNNLNMQSFHLSVDLSFENLSDRVAQHSGENLSEIFEDVSYLLRLDDFSTNEEEGIVDISCKHFTQREELDVDSEYTAQVIDPEGDVESEIGGEHRIRAPNSQIVEARVYTETSIVAISNSQVNRGLQNDYIKVIRGMAGEDNEESLDNE